MKKRITERKNQQKGIPIQERFRPTEMHTSSKKIAGVFFWLRPCMHSFE